MDTEFWVDKFGEWRIVVSTFKYKNRIDSQYLLWQYAVASGEVKPRDGVIELFDEARNLGLKVGVCSAATKSSAICVLENLLGLDRFRVSSWSLISNHVHLHGHIHGSPSSVSIQNCFTELPIPISSGLCPLFIPCGFQHLERSSAFLAETSGCLLLKYLLLGVKVMSTLNVWLIYCLIWSTLWSRLVVYWKRHV